MDGSGTPLVRRALVTRLIALWQHRSFVLGVPGRELRRRYLDLLLGTIRSFPNRLAKIFVAEVQPLLWATRRDPGRESATESPKFETYVYPYLNTTGWHE